MKRNNESIIIKFDFSSEQTVGEITKIVGLVGAKYMVPIIDGLNLEANPRASKTGSVTEAIQESIEKDPLVFPFKTKGILLAASNYERLERNRMKIITENVQIEGILDGGHNTLAIGLHILSKALDFKEIKMPKGSKTWDAFKALWTEYRDVIDEYLKSLKSEDGNRDLDFYVPIELLVPKDIDDFSCVESFKNDLLDICAARNNNVQLQISAKANQLGYFDTFKQYMDLHNADISNRIEWKTNDGGDIKIQDIIALTWIPLSLITPVRDTLGKTIEPVAAYKLYSGKGNCLKQFERLMSSPDVTVEASSDYKRELKNDEVCSAFKVAVSLPELYDYIFEMFPKYYNSTGGNYGRIIAVKNLNKKKKNKQTPFTNKIIETVSPDGFVMPLVYGLQALMENKNINGHNSIEWSGNPMIFLHNNLEKIISYYSGIFSLCDYDPQKVGKNPQSYAQALAGFKMAIAGIL